MKWRFLIISCIFIPVFITASGQNKLLIRKSGKPPKYIFYEGDPIRFRLKGEEHWKEAYILGLNNDEIRFHYVTISLNEIAEVDVRNMGKGQLAQSFGSLFRISGIAFPVIDQFNRTFIRHRPGVDEKSILIGGALLSVGSIFLLFRQRKVEIGDTYFITIHEQ